MAMFHINWSAEGSAEIEAESSSEAAGMVQDELFDIQIHSADITYVDYVDVSDRHR